MKKKKFFHISAMTIVIEKSLYTILENLYINPRKKKKCIEWCIDMKVLKIHETSREKRQKRPLEKSRNEKFELEYVFFLFENKENMFSSFFSICNTN